MKINRLEITEEVAEKLVLLNCVFQTQQLIKIRIGKYFFTVEKLLNQKKDK